MNAGVTRIRWHDLAIVVLLCALGAIAAQRDIEDNVPFADEVEYVLMAHNLFHRNVLSLTRQSDVPAIPTAYREPGYPILLAGMMAIDKQMAAVSIDCLIKRDTVCANGYSWSKQINVLMLLLTGIVVWVLAWRLTGRSWIAHIGLLLCLANLELHEYATYLVSDFLALLLMALGSFALYLSGTKIDWRWSGIAGFLLGLLVLTKAAFVLLAITVLAVFLICAFRAQEGQRRKFVQLAAVFAISHMVIVGSWVVRNWIELGAPMITQRGGHVLAHRVELNTMTPSEYGIAFLWWTRGFGDNLARKLVSVEDYTRFELRDPNGFYNAAQTKWIAEVAKQREAGAVDQFDAEAAVGRQMRNTIIEHWFKNLLVTLPVGYRGLFIDEFIVLTFPCLVLLIVSRRRRTPGFLWFALPGVYGLAFHAGLTLHLPRHSIPLLPTLAVAGALGVGWIADWIGQRWRDHREDLAEKT
ncbi:MAG: hypothetical protein O3A21_04720 [Proteobacteria bacterium]|nr:hypothetical protein [Pseudomonadota bacterium]